MKKPETRKTCLYRNEYCLDHDKNYNQRYRG